MNTLVKAFVRKVSLMRGLSEAAADAAGGKIFTFGSYRLGVHGPGSDIDTLCVVPKHVSREDFYEIFEPMLKEVEGVTEVAVRGLPISSIRKLTLSIGSTGSLRTHYLSKYIRNTARLSYGKTGIVFDTRRPIFTR